MNLRERWNTWRAGLLRPSLERKPDPRLQHQLEIEDTQRRYAELDARKTRLRGLIQDVPKSDQQLAIKLRVELEAINAQMIDLHHELVKLTDGWNAQNQRKPARSPLTHP